MLKALGQAQAAEQAKAQWHLLDVDGNGEESAEETKALNMKKLTV